MPGWRRLYIRHDPRMADGTLEMVCNLDAGRMLGPWYLFASSDNGAHWTQKQIAWPEELNTELSNMQFAAWDNQGGMYLYYSTFTQEQLDAMMSGAGSDETVAAPAEEEQEQASSEDVPAADTQGGQEDAIETQERLHRTISSILHRTELYARLTGNCLRMIAVQVRSACQVAEKRRSADKLLFQHRPGRPRDRRGEKPLSGGIIFTKLLLYQL